MDPEKPPKGRPSAAGERRTAQPLPPETEIVIGDERFEALGQARRGRGRRALRHDRAAAPPSGHQRRRAPHVHRRRGPDPRRRELAAGPVLSRHSLSVTPRDDDRRAAAGAALVDRRAQLRLVGRVHQPRDQEAGRREDPPDLGARAPYAPHLRPRLRAAAHQELSLGAGRGRHRAHLRRRLSRHVRGARHAPPQARHAPRAQGRRHHADARLLRARRGPAQDRSCASSKRRRACTAVRRAFA